ncbi:hypothetical protein [Bacillus toyonensis]|uniref:Uncharacterized protein n=1 Tax=Bacillus toyonensis TaxID=155322 RepID=A0A2A8HE34_9BACI|nr:hypothetical protein [Bacillus toyonensis]PEQ04961.1 hypothetical protein CN585_16615 [Bacillus toyonensis]
MNVDWMQVFSWIASTFIGSGIVKLIVDKKISQVFTNQTESYKAELGKINNKYQTTFNKLHETRAEVIKDLYAKLVKLELSVKRLVTPEGGISFKSDEERSMEILKNFIELDDFFEVNKIYFKGEIRNLFEELEEKMRIIQVTFDSYYVFSEHLKSEDVEVMEERKQEMMDCIEKVPEIKEILEEQFQKLLGVIED